MVTKICKRCSLELSVENFSTYPYRGKRYLRAYCKPCMRDYNNSIYHKYQEYKLKYAKERYAREVLAGGRKKQFKERCIAYLGNHCVICDKVYPWYVYDFHHTNPKEKDNVISRLTCKPWDDVLEELNKCVLVCSNCHREIHYGYNK